MSTQLQSAEAILRNLPRLKDEALRRSRRKIDTMYPETGPLRRELYYKHMEFFEASAKYAETLALCANRVGKTTCGAYATALHLTGQYPDWWPGRRFKHATTGWVCNTSGTKVRDINQFELLGPPGAFGTGMIPGDAIITTKSKSGVADGVEIIYVKHVNGGHSRAIMKSYQEGREGFQGERPNFIWPDEEPPGAIDEEMSMRLMSTVPGQPGGIKYITFTPLEGYTTVVKSYLESDDPDKHVVKMGWRHVPHLTVEEIEKMSKKYLPSQLRARSEGEPSMGLGAVYPVEDVEALMVDPFQIPATWPRWYGMDVGKTAVIWFAWDRDADVMYLWDEYYSEQYNPALHALAIKARGEWIPGVVDPSSLQSSQHDGEKLVNTYRTLGLKLATADNAVEAGIQEVWMRLSTGRLKIFKPLGRWKEEFGRYHRRNVETVFGIQSKIVKKFDHLQDATRYGVCSGPAIGKCNPTLDKVRKPNYKPKFASVNGANHSFMG